MPGQNFDQPFCTLQSVIVILFIILCEEPIDFLSYSFQYKDLFLGMFLDSTLIRGHIFIVFFFGSQAY